MDFVSRKELSNDASIESVDDWGVSMSTSVARDLVHDLVELVAIRRPTIQSANEEGYWIYANTPCRKNVLLNIIVMMKAKPTERRGELQKSRLGKVARSRFDVSHRSPPTAL